MLEPRGILRIFTCLLAPLLMVQTWIVLHANLSFGTFFATLPIPSLIHLGTLNISVILYRLSPFHPLAGYPGPLICKVTKLWTAYLVHRGDRHRYYLALYAKYGPFVRIGPNQLMIADIDAIPTVMGPKPFRKGERYGVTSQSSTPRNMINLVDFHEHAARRKLWEPSMNTSAVQEHTVFIAKRLGNLCRSLEISGRKAETVDLAGVISCFAFDVMGDFAFAGGFNLLEQGGDKNGYARAVEGSLGFQEALGAVPWSNPFLNLILLLRFGKELLHFKEFAYETVKARVVKGGKYRDLFYYMLDEGGQGTPVLTLPNLMTEATLAIAAGSDTSSTTITNILYYLISHPKVLARLRNEIDSEFPAGAEIVVGTTLTNMKYLNAVLNETLRLQPVIPSGTQRELLKGKGPVTVAGRIIPEGTTVQIPPYIVQRSSEYFPEDPECFRPERWLEDKVNQQAFIPFSWGAANCAGKHFAMVEMRMTIATLVQKFDMKFAPGYDPTEWEANLADRFILNKEKLPVTITSRY